MERNSVCLSGLLSIALSLVLGPQQLVAQDTHTPTYFGVFFDARDGLVELTQPANGNVSSGGQQNAFLSTGTGWNGADALFTNQSAIVIYGDEYSPSGVQLYKCSTTIDPQRKQGTYTFSPIRLRVGPFPGVQGKCYKLTPETPFEDTDYMIQFNNKWFGLSLNRDRQLNPIKDNMSDLCITDMGIPVASTNGGVYVNDGVWRFVPLRGKFPTRVVPALDKKGSFYFWNESVDTVLGLASISDGQVVVKDMSLPGAIGHSLILTYHPRKIRDVVVHPKNPNKLFIVGEGFRAGPEFISEYVLAYGEDGPTYTVSTQKLESANCAMMDPANSNIVIVGTTKGVWASTNAGEDWGEIPNWPVNMMRLATAPDKPGTVCFANDGVLWYDSDSKRWFSCQWTQGNVTSFYWDTKSVLASTENRGVFSSLDAGKTWQEMNNGLMSRKVRRIITDPANSDIIFAATESGLFKSTNRGNNWTQQ